jgi:hypothetical protein
VRTSQVQTLGQVAVESAKEPAPAAAIAGTVFGEQGAPAAHAPVMLLGSSPQPLFRTQTDAQGQFRFEQLAAGEYRVRAGGQAGGLATVPAVTTTGTTAVTLVLSAGSRLAGRVRTTEGAPTNGAIVEWYAADGSWCDSATTAEDGTFAFANLPGTPGTVLAWLPDYRMPACAAMNVLGDAGELLLQHDPAASACLTIEPLLAEGREDTPVEVLVWSLDSQLGTTVPAGEKGPRRLPNLPAGWYQVELRAAGAGHVDGGRHWLDAKGSCDLGRVRMPVGGRVRFAVNPDQLPAGEQPTCEVCVLRADMDVRVEAATSWLDELTQLPAGDYALACQHRDGGIRYRRFTVRDGEETVVAVPE